MLIKFKEEISQVHLSTYRLRINVKMKHSSVKVQTMPVMEKTRILGSVSVNNGFGSDSKSGSENTNFFTSKI